MLVCKVDILIVNMSRGFIGANSQFSYNCPFSSGMSNNLSMGFDIGKSIAAQPYTYSQPSVSSGITIKSTSEQFPAIPPPMHVSSYLNEREAHYKKYGSYMCFDIDRKYGI